MEGKTHVVNFYFHYIKQKPLEMLKCGAALRGIPLLNNCSLVAAAFPTILFR